MGDREFGIRMYADALRRDQLSPEMSYLYVYSQYLIHGGTPDEFMNLTADDIQLMYATDRINHQKTAHDIADILAGMFGKERR